MLGKLSWPAHDQIRGVNGSDVGDLSACIFERWLFEVPNSRRRMPYIVARARHDPTIAIPDGNLTSLCFFFFFGC